MSDGRYTMCASTNGSAAGKTSFCASAIVKYSTAWSGCTIVITMAGGNAHLIQSLIVCAAMSKEPSDCAQYRVGSCATRLAVDYVLIIELEDEFRGREH